MNYCPNCGSQIKQGDLFCRTCGTKAVVNQVPPVASVVPVSTTTYVGAQQPVQPQQQFYSSQPVQQPMYGGQPVQQQVVYNQNMNMSDEILVDAYIGKNADKLKNGGFSANVFFLGILYVLYRKMWTLGILWFVANMIVSMFLPTFSYIITLIANITISIKFKNMYLQHVREKVATIKAENQGLPQEQLMLICSKKGGTTLWPVIVYIVVIGLIFMLAFIGIMSTIEDSEEKANGYNDSYYDYDDSYYDYSDSYYDYDDSYYSTSDTGNLYLEEA